MNILKGILVGFGVAFIVVILWLVFSPEQDNQEVSDSFETEFIIGCTGEDASYDFCKCTYDYLDDKTTNKELLRISVDYLETEEIPDIMLDAALYCYGEL